MSRSERHEPDIPDFGEPPAPGSIAATLEGSLDAVKGWTAYGWAMDATRPDEAVTVALYDNLRKIGTVVADLFRHDLRKEGKGNGEHGFAFNLANVFDPARSSILFSGEHHSISAKVAGTDFFLAGSPLQVDPSPPEPGERGTKGKFCTMPFEKFVIDAGGSVFLCCPSYLPVPVGNAYRQNFEEIWNSDTAKELRRSIVDGDFKYCLDVCPAIQQGLLPEITSVDSPRYEAALSSRDFSLPSGPTHLSLLHDRTCNLSCPSCRTEVLVALGQEKQRLKAALANVIRPMLGSVETLEFAGGELFASKHLREVLAAIDREEQPNLRIAYVSNGTLFNEE